MNFQESTGPFPDEKSGVLEGSVTKTRFPEPLRTATPHPKGQEAGAADRSQGTHPSQWSDAVRATAQGKSGEASGQQEDQG